MSHIDPLHDPENVKAEDFEFNNDEEEPKLEPVERDQVEDALDEVNRENARAIGITL